MNPKKRLKMSLNGERVDRPPCICPGGMMNMVTAELMERVGIYLPEAHTDARKMADLAKAVYEQGCFENCGVPVCMTIEAEEMGARVDLGSQIYEPHVIKYAIDSVSDYEKLSGIDLTKGRAKVVLDAIRKICRSLVISQDRSVRRVQLLNQSYFIKNCAKKMQRHMRI